MNNRFWHCAAAVLLLTLVPLHAGAAEITIIPVEGFDDSTHRDEAGDNPGTNVGDRRLNALEYAANLLGARIQSPVEIRVRARFSDTELDCTRDTATTGAAGPQTSLAFTENDRPSNDIQPNVFYPIALANALAGEDLLPPDNNQGPETDIGAVFNSRIDSDPMCLTGIQWYYGYDGNPPQGDLDFLSTAVHELIHGLGFLSGVDLNTGKFASDGDGNRMPFIYDTLIRDLNMGLWPRLTPNQRQASLTNEGNVVFAGRNSSANGAPTLVDGNVDGCIQLHTPRSLTLGSSISHWADDLRPNALMEPDDTGDIQVNDGIDLATCALADLGWELAANVSCPDQSGGSSSQVSANGPARCAISNTSSTDSDDGGGGGCTLSSDTNRIAPLLPLLIAAGLFGIHRRRSA